MARHIYARFSRFSIDLPLGAKLPNEITIGMRPDRSLIQPVIYEGRLHFCRRCGVDFLPPDRCPYSGDTQVLGRDFPYPGFVYEGSPTPVTSKEGVPWRGELLLHHSLRFSSKQQGGPRRGEVLLLHRVCGRWLASPSGGSMLPSDLLLFEEWKKMDCSWRKMAQ